MGTLLGYKVHHEDPVFKVPQATKALPANAARLRNIIHVSNHIMSHILHFYHLVALDYVKPTVHLGGGTFSDINRPFLAPRYDDNYYINDARILAIVGTGLVPGPAVAVLTTLPGVGPAPGYVGIGNAVNAYLVGQYLKALDIRRMCHEMQAIFSGRAPQCNGWTPGGATTSFQQADINNYQAMLNQVKAFVGEPLDFATGKAGTMMFDVVAAAHLFPEYFWIGNSYGHFMAYGWGEEAGTIALSEAYPGNFATLFVNMPNSSGDNRASARGYKMSAQTGAALNAIDIKLLGESIANSRYQKVGLNYPNGDPFRHPWLGKTYPVPTNEYSWLKSPRYNVGGTFNLGTLQVDGGTWHVFEVGPLARMVVAGAYFAGILNVAGYPIAPVWGSAGPNLSTGSGHPLESVYAAIPGVTGGPNLSGVAYTGDSVLDRIAARAIETRLMIDMAQHFLGQLAGTIGVDGYGTTGITDPKVPVVSQVFRGYGMTEASRGALGHWIAAKNGKIDLYQAIVPTTWNASPRDVNNNEGPAERSLQGTGPADSTWVANPAEPIELPRVTHSYDFCIACAVHLITPKGDVVKVDVPALPG
ncbi:MAG: nickel-dependent hydrogenase large subunit [Nitrospirota bacterium]